MKRPTVSSTTVSGVTGGFPATLVRRAVDTVLAAEGVDAVISVTFLGSGQMRELNRDYKHHDYPTDVISFALPQPDGGLTGDVYVCRPVAAKEAHQRRIPLREEVIRLVVHGTLHVLGQDHPEGVERERSPMWRRQEELVGELTQ